jgi:hypothetical protein
LNCRISGRISGKARYRISTKYPAGYPVSGFLISRISGRPDIRQKQYPLHPYKIFYAAMSIPYFTQSASWWLPVAPVAVLAGRWWLVYCNIPWHLLTNFIVGLPLSVYRKFLECASF